MDWLELSQEEFEEFREIQIRPRADWPAAFSCNFRKEVWPFVSYGLTYEEHRRHLKGKIELLDEIVERVLAERPSGGRFYLNDRGVFSDAEGNESIVLFQIV